MSIEQLHFGNSYLSLQRPAWTSTILSCFHKSTMNSTSEQKGKQKRFTFLRTRNAIYDRVEILKDLSSLLVIKFMCRKGKSKKLVTESIKKSDILERRNYKD